VADTCDSLAYNAHDIDDAISLGIIEFSDLDGSKIWKKAFAKAQEILPKEATATQTQLGAIRILIDMHVYDLVENTRKNIAMTKAISLDQVRDMEISVVCHSPEIEDLKHELGSVLKQKIYNNFRVQRMANKGARFVKRLFFEFSENPLQLPERYKTRIITQGLHRTVCDYIAGMTDRFAQNEYMKIFNPYFDV
jgi:dGTPase